MADYRDDLERFLQDQQVRERDAKHAANLAFLAEHYGSATPAVLKNRRRPTEATWHLSKPDRDGRIKRLPSPSDFENYSDLTDVELAELIVQKISAWDELEDVTDLKL